MKPVGVKGLKAFDMEIAYTSTGKQLLDEVQAKVPSVPVSLICLGKNVDPLTTL